MISGHVDLADFHFRGVPDTEARQVAELDRLTRDRKGTGNDRLRGDDRCRRCQNDEGIKPPGRHRAIEWIVHRGGIARAASRPARSS